MKTPSPVPTDTPPGGLTAGDDGTTVTAPQEEGVSETRGGAKIVLIVAIAMTLAILAGGAAYVVFGLAPADNTANRGRVLDIPAPGQAAAPAAAVPGNTAIGGLQPPPISDETPDSDDQPPPQTVAVDAAAFDAMPKGAAAAPLETSPADDLIETGAEGPLPRISSDGRQPWKVYARPFDQRDDRPRVAVVIAGLGLSAAVTQAAIDRLPAAVTLAFDPYADDLDQWIPMARGAGHEVLLGLPMEPFDFPRSDPGPLGLLKTVPPAENITRLHKILGKGRAYIGLITTMGSSFSTSDAFVKPVVEALSQRGLMVVDSRTNPDSQVSVIAGQVGTARAVVDVTLDRIPAKTAIDTALIDLETTARDQAVALGLAAPLPVTLERVAHWAAGLAERNVALVPVSAIANRQFGR